MTGSKCTHHIKIMFKNTAFQWFSSSLLIFLTIQLKDANADIKKKLVDIDAKLDSIKPHFPLDDAKFHQLENKIDHIDNQIKIMSNALMHQSKVSEMSLLNERLLILENNLGQLTIKMDVLSLMNTKLDQFITQFDGTQDTRGSRPPNPRLPISVSTPSEMPNRLDAFAKQIENVVQEQRHIKNTMESYVKIAEQLNKTLEKFNSRVNQPFTLGRSPPSLVLPESTSMRNVMVDLLETASLVADEDNVNGSVAAALQAQANVDGGGKDRNKNNPKKSHTADLLRQLWKKFTRPILNLNTNLAGLEEISLKGIDLCERSLNQASKLETIISNHFAKIQPTAAPDTRCCDIVLKRIDSTASRMDGQFGDLEQRIFNHVSLTEKIFDKLTTMKGHVVSGDNEKSAVMSTDSDIAASDCAELQDNGKTVNGIYTIYVNGKRLDVYCDFQSYGGGWTVIQRRGYFPNNQENFNRNWEEYKTGFGYTAQEFWLGNENIHWMTTAKNMTLLVQLKDFDGNHAFAFYNIFKVDTETELYRLHVGEYNGNASDSFAAHDQKPFSTFDKINDEVDPCCSCALTFEGGWWFYACFEAHLNGPYQNNPTDNGYFKGIIWEHWKGDYSLLMSEMKIRPRNYQGDQRTSVDYDDSSVEDP